jgi:ATP-dependent DNA helicase RecG
MFQNRLEIQNPGGLFGPVNEDNLGDPGIQAARNQYLMQLLEDLGPAENRGSGIVTMTRAMRDAQMSPPEFVDRRTTFRVVFPNDTMLDDVTVEWLNRFAHQDLTENQRLALAYTLHQEEINNRAFCLLTGADSRDATTDLHDLVSKDLLKQEGSHRWTTYRLTPAASQTSAEEEQHVSARVGRRVVAAERQQRILRLVASKGTISARSIVEELGIPRATVNYDLRKLTESGRVERTQDDPYDPRNQYRIRIKKRRK